MIFDRIAPALVPTLQFLIPLRLLAYRRQGGPTDSDWERARSYPLWTRGDEVQFRGETPARELVAQLADALAVLAHQPGGVRAFGHHWEAGR